MDKMSPERMEILGRLETEIEDAWNSGAEGGHDGTIVNRLAREYPDLAEDLYVFFAALVTTTLDPDRKRPNLAQVDERTLEWLKREGFQRVAAAYRESLTSTPSMSSSGQSVLATLKHHTGEAGEAIAQMLHITPGFLLGLSQYPSTAPQLVRRELARRAHAAFGIDETITIAAFDAPVALKRAASRTGAYRRSTVTFEEIVNRSRMDPKQKEFWRRLGRQNSPNR